MNNKIIEQGVFITFALMNKYPGMDWLTAGLYEQIKYYARNEEGYCSATNEEFATLFGVSKSTIFRMISYLIEVGLITRELENNNERKLYIVENNL